MVLQIKDLKKAYRDPAGGVVPVLDIPEFSLEAGEVVALRGASGSGKTTLLHILAGILTADSGRVTLAGQALDELSEAARDRLRGSSVGYIFQTFNLLQGYTALENVEMAMYLGSRVDRPRAQALLAQVGLADRADYRPRQLSVGQQQRVAVARAVANRPKLVLADEPTGNLDPTRAEEILDVIGAACAEAGAALLLVSHDPTALARYSRVVDLAELNRAAVV